MKNQNLLAVLTLSLICFFNASFSQKIFSEGSIRYNVFIKSATTPEGIYVVSVKGGNIRKELSMNSGFTNVTIYNQKNGTSTSLNVGQDAKYALQLSMQEVKEKNKKFDGASFSMLNETKKIANHDCIGVMVVYQDKEKATVFYTPELTPQNESFNTMFPGLKGIPLEYEVKSGADITMKFVATSVDSHPIDSKIFTIPSDVKIISKEELQNLK